MGSMSLCHSGFGGNGRVHSKFKNGSSKTLQCVETQLFFFPKALLNHFFSLNGDLQRAIDCVRGLRPNGKMGRIPTPTHCATTADLDFLVLEMFSFSFQSCWQWWHTYTDPLTSHDMVQCWGGLWWHRLHHPCGTQALLSDFQLHQNQKHDTCHMKSNKLPSAICLFPHLY